MGVHWLLVLKSFRVLGRLAPRLPLGEEDPLKISEIPKGQHPGWRPKAQRAPSGCDQMFKSTSINLSESHNSLNDFRVNRRINREGNGCHSSVN